MATTVVAPVANSITLASKYLPLLDEVYKRGSLTSMLDTDAARVQWTGAQTVNMLVLTEMGLANYNRNSGYIPGDTNGSWEPFQLQIDRGRSYQVDAMDNEETLDLVVGNLLGETERVQVIPEVDAYRFAKWAGATGISTATAADITVGTTDVPALIDVAEAQMDDDEVPYEGRILFVSPTCYSALKQKIERRVINSEDNVNTNVEFYDDMRIVRVPSGRFHTTCTLNAPTASNGVGGYTAGGKAINFMIVHPSAILQVVKHLSPRLFTPEQNIEADAYRLNYRIYHDTFVLPQKAKGIYLHNAAT